MNAQEARELANKFKAGSGKFNKKIYNTAMREVKKAAKNGKFSVKFNIYTTNTTECIGVVNKLQSDGYGVAWTYHPDPIGVAGRDPEDYMEFTVKWKE